MTLAIQVADLGGGRIGLGRAAVRYFAKVPSAVTLFIGFVMAGSPPASRHFTTSSRAVLS